MGGRDGATTYGPNIAALRVSISLVPLRRPVGLIDMLDPEPFLPQLF